MAIWLVLLIKMFRVVKMSLPLFMWAVWPITYTRLVLILVAIRRAGRGYRHAETFGMAIMFFCGKLKLMPDWK